MTETEAWAAHLPPHEGSKSMTIDTSTEAVERLLDGVTPGPWRIKDCDTLGDRCTHYFQEIWNDETDILVTTEVTRAHNDGGAKNMRFIRAARDLVPALLKERDEARAQLARREEMHDCAMKERDDATLYADEQKARVKALEEALLVARDHVAINAQGWPVGRRASREDLSIVDAALAASIPAVQETRIDIAAIENGGRRWHGEDHRVVSVRWKPYKPDGQRQMKAKGRWQEQVGSGDYWRWQNCDRPAALAASIPADPVTSAGCCQAVEAERDDLRAKLDEAVKALRDSRETHVGIADYCLKRAPMTPTAGIFADSQRARLAIDATLAKIKGADHE